jgi:hypothetical protein
VNGFEIMANVHAIDRTVPADPDRGGAKRSSKRKFVVAVAVVVVAALSLAVWIWREGAERRALLRMPAAERAALYQETRASAEALCQQAEKERWLEDRCHSALQFLAAFPECDESCASLVRRHTAQPAR